MTTLYISEGGPKSGWYRPPKGTHGPGSQPRGPKGLKAGTLPTPEGAANNHNVYGLLNDASDAASWQTATREQRATLKAKIVGNLAEGSDIQGADVNEAMKSWAYSSNDNDMRSLSIQQDAAKEFGVPLSEFTKGKIAETMASGRLTQRATSETDQRKVLRAMYDETQSRLAGAGLKPSDKVTLYRGTRLPASDIAGSSRGDAMPVKGNAVSSWSVGSGVAEMFGTPEEDRYGVVLKMDVPVKNILSIAATGLGCLTEGEVTVLDAGGTAEIAELYEPE